MHSEYQTAGHRETARQMFSPIAPCERQLDGADEVLLTNVSRFSGDQKTHSTTHQALEILPNGRVIFCDDSLSECDHCRMWIYSFVRCWVVSGIGELCKQQSAYRAQGCCSPGNIMIILGKDTDLVYYEAELAATLLCGVSYVLKGGRSYVSTNEK
jgi:hypothetical protein